MAGGSTPIGALHIFSEEFQAKLAEKTAAVAMAKRRFLTQGAAIIERQAKVNATGGRHRAGTPTPASHGTGPAIISGTLRRSIHSEVGIEVARIGPSVRYGRRVELEYNYPFMIPAAKFAAHIALPVLARKVFGEAVSS